MTSNESRKVWYRLFESSTGLAYRNTSADKVSVSINADVADFRDAVQAKNSNKLSNFDASDLVVYKNINAFEKRKATEEKQEPLDPNEKRNADESNKQEPLDPTESLCDLGTKEDMLIVAVPHPTVINTRAIDISETLYESLTLPFDKEPSLQELKEILTTKPLTPLPLFRYALVVMYFFLGAEKYKEYFYPSSEVNYSMAPSIESLPTMNVDLGRGTKEDTVHFYVDFFMKQFLKPLLSAPSRQIAIDRNSRDFSNTTLNRRLRPDFLFYVNNCLILRGEEKKDTAGLVTAKNELIQKMKNWNNAIYGSLNYVFAYVCAGPSFLLCAISPLGITDISRVLDLQILKDRFDLFFLLINLARVIKTIEGRIPLQCPMLYNLMKRADGGTIEIRDDVVVKRIFVSNSALDERLQFLEQLYRSMSLLPVPFVSRCHEIRKCTRTVDDAGFIEIVIVPIGCRLIPPTINLLITVLSCVLRALRGVHDLCYAHCDIRWANILRVTDDNWVLIDFENARKLEDPNDTLYQDDIRMVGKLIYECENYLAIPQTISTFASTLVWKTPLTVSAALILLENLNETKYRKV